MNFQSSMKIPYSSATLQLAVGFVSLAGNQMGEMAALIYQEDKDLQEITYKV